MSSLSVAASRPPSRWVISPAWDLATLIAAPLAIAPLVFWASTRFEADQVFLVVVSFASIGHHLPGFMRAYGDRELFNRFRWRFLIAPPAAICAALFFSWRDLHGLELVLLVWATWHVLMQTYGFMRIYDMKLGRQDAWDARLDLALCLTVFCGGVVFSDARVYAIADTLLKSGIALPDASWLLALRWAVGGAAMVVLAAYVARLVLGRKLNWAKLLLVATTGWLYWISGTLSTDVLIGVAMFEIFHALQYDVIVWAYNRRLAQRAGSKFGPLGFLFQDRWARVGMYLAAIAAFGSLRYFGQSLENATLQRVLFAALSGSTLLHFYYDGFIWKVSQPKTRENLDIQSTDAAGADFSAAAHAGKWLLLTGLLAALFIMETDSHEGSEAQSLATLAAWTPELPELQTRLMHDALARGDFPAATRAAAVAVALRPHSHAAHSNHGVALLRAGRFAEAAEEFEAALTLSPAQWQNQLDLAICLAATGNSKAADVSFATAAATDPQNAAIHQAWAEACSKHGDLRAAIVHYRAALGLSSDASQAAGMHHELALAHMRLADYSAARDAIESAVALDPRHAQAHFQRGNLRLQSEDLAGAADSYRRSLALSSPFAPALVNLGAVLAADGDVAQAAIAYRDAIAADPKNASAHYNLGLLLLGQQQPAEAREHLREAIRLGQEPSSEVQSWLDANGS